MRIPATWFCLIAAVGPGWAQKSLFYMTDSADSVRSALEHMDRIDILGPQMYSVDADGIVWGALNPAVAAAVREKKVAVMPLIVNPGFNQTLMHGLLVNKTGRARMIATLIEECKRHGWLGIQFDFENIAYADRDLFTGLVKETADALHAAGLQLSLAAVPRFSDYAGRGDYAKWMFTNWRGSFDLKAIGEACDFVSFMTYDQHTRNTPPGPVGGMPWIEAQLQYALQFVPKEKLSVGIATYGRRWYAGMRDKDTPGIVLASASYREATTLAAQFKAAIQWDDRDQAPWFWFERDSIREYVWFNDVRSFRAQYGLIRKYGLHGFSAWVLGVEDPAIWGELRR